MRNYIQWGIIKNTSISVACWTLIIISISMLNHKFLHLHFFTPFTFTSSSQFPFSDSLMQYVQFFFSFLCCIALIFLHVFRCLCGCLWMRTWTGWFQSQSSPKRKSRPSLSPAAASSQSSKNVLANGSEPTSNPVAAWRRVALRYGNMGICTHVDKQTHTSAIILCAITIPQIIQNVSHIKAYRRLCYTPFDSILLPSSGWQGHGHSFLTLFLALSLI